MVDAKKLAKGLFQVKLVPFLEVSCRVFVEEQSLQLRHFDPVVQVAEEVCFISVLMLLQPSQDSIQPFVALRGLALVSFQVAVYEVEALEANCEEEACH